MISGNLVVEVKRAIGYLGVMIDSKLTFVPHFRAVSAVAVEAAKAIDRLMPNAGGLLAAKK